MKNKILQGDCLEILKGIPDNSIDCIITDPPYSTPVITSFGRKKVKNLADLSIQEFYFSALKKEFERVLRDNGRVFIFCDDKFYPILFAVFYDWLNIGLMVWDKKRIGMGNPIRKRHELIMYANRDSFDYNRTEGITHYPSIVEFSLTEEKEHGAQKPIELLKYLIKGFTNEGDTVLDTFAGSGSTLVAAKELNRGYIGIEMNPEYIDIINKRLST
jgi:site-specific DNA-methyltransferase (adenine-specific)